jgi:hypothetical protein
VGFARAAPTVATREFVVSVVAAGRTIGVSVVVAAGTAVVFVAGRTSVSVEAAAARV